MKYLVIIFAIIMTGANGQLGVGLIARNRVRRMINEVSDNIIRLGFDPYIIPGDSFNLNIPGTNVLLVEAGSEGIEIKGIADIELDQFTYLELISRATFTVILPNITINFDDTYVRLKFFDFSSRLNGSVSILGTSLSGQLRIRGGAIRPYSIRDADVDFTVGRIQSNLQVILTNQDISDRVNNFWNTTIPNVLSENSSNINELLEAIILDVGQSG